MGKERKSHDLVQKSPRVGRLMSFRASLKSKGTSIVHAIKTVGDFLGVAMSSKKEFFSLLLIPLAILWAIVMVPWILWRSK